MYAAQRNSVANQYASVNLQSSIEDASPHRLIQLLFEGFLARVNAAKGAIQNGNYEVKSQSLSKAIAIIGGLEEVLDFEKGEELAENLAALYRYVRNLLIDASLKNETSKIDEAVSLIREIKDAWDQIPQQIRGGS